MFVDTFLVGSILDCSHTYHVHPLSYLSAPVDSMFIRCQQTTWSSWTWMRVRLSLPTVMTFSLFPLRSVNHAYQHFSLCYSLLSPLSSLLSPLSSLLSPLSSLLSPLSSLLSPLSSPLLSPLFPSPLLSSLLLSPPFPSPLLTLHDYLSLSLSFPCLSLPLSSPQVIANLKHILKKQSSAYGATVARAFMLAQVSMLGGYRSALKLRQGQKEVTFDEDA